MLQRASEEALQPSQLPAESRSLHWLEPYNKMLMSFVLIKIRGFGFARSRDQKQLAQDIVQTILLRTRGKLENFLRSERVEADDFLS